MITRYPGNPIISANSMPYASTFTYNAGVVKYHDQYFMIFRNFAGEASQEAIDLEGTTLAWALSQDGITWDIRPDHWIEPADMKRLLAPFCGQQGEHEILRVYDPRLTAVEDTLYLCFAADTLYGTRGGIGVISEDLRSLSVLSLSAPDNRNFVLFPERIDGKLVRLERPMPMYSPKIKEFAIWLSASTDGVAWDSPRIVLYPGSVPFAKGKLGPAAPPIKTPRGWLTTFHGVNIVDAPLKAWDVEPWHKEYLPGVMLLDLADPTKVIGIARQPLLTPTGAYELEGFRGSILFPGGLIAEPDGEVKLYYGAADTVECLAITTIDELLELCQMEGQQL